MGAAMSSPVFQRLYEEWRKAADPARKARMSRVLFAAKERESEIIGFRTRRAWERNHDTCRPELNGTRMTGEMHPLEVEACRLLCPILEIGRGPAKTKGWTWVLNQPWAQDLKTAKLGKQFY